MDHSIVPGLLLLLSVASAFAGTEANLLPNGGFEQFDEAGACKSWQMQPGEPANTADTVTDHVRRGRRSLCLKAAGTKAHYADCLSDTFVVTPDTPYVLTFHAHAAGAVFTHFFGADDNQLSAPYRKFSARRWGRTAHGFRTPPDAATVSVRFRTYAPGGSVWIDDVNVAEKRTRKLRLGVPNPSAEWNAARGECEGWTLAPSATGNTAEVVTDRASSGRCSLHIRSPNRHYADVLTTRFRIAPGTPYVLSFDSTSPTGGRVFTHVLGADGEPVNVPEGDDGLHFRFEASPGGWQRHAVPFTAGTEAREIYLRFRVYSSRGEAWIDAVQIDEQDAAPFDAGEELQLRASLRHHAFVRGTNAPVTATVLSRAEAHSPGLLVLRATRDDHLVWRGVRELEIGSAAQALGRFDIDTAHLSCGTYDLELSLAVKGRDPVLTREHLTVVPPRRPTLGFGFYGYSIAGITAQGSPRPALTRQSTDTGLALLASANMTVFNANVGAGEEFVYFLDGLLERGIEYLPLLNLYFPCTTDDETEIALDANGGRNSVHTSPERPNLSLFSPTARQRAAQGTREALEKVSWHPAFAGRFYFGDDVAMWRGKPDIYSGPLQDYSPRVVEAFRSKTGREPPRRTKEELAAVRGVVPDDDPWVEWMRFRCRDIVGAYQAAVTEAKNDIVPSAAGGPQHGCVWWPGIGAVPSYELREVDLLTYYAYPHYAPYHLFHCALAFLGGRDKELWATPSAHNNCWGQWYGERTPEYERSSFFSILASGAKAVTFCPFQSRPQFTEGHPAVWAELRRLGRLVEEFGPLLYRLRNPRRPLGLLISLTTSAYRVHDMLPRPYPAEDTHVRSVAGTFFTLLRAHLPVELVDEETILRGDTEHLHALLLSDVQVLPRAVAQRLEGFAEAGGALFLDDRCKVDLRGAAHLGEHFGLHPAAPVAPPAAVRKLAERARTALRGTVPEIIPFDNPEISVHELEGSGVRYLFLVNLDVKRPQTARVEWPKGVVPHEILTGIDLTSSEGLRLEPGGGALVALLPGRIGQILIQAPPACAQTEVLRVTVRLRDDADRAMAGLVPLRLTFVGPAGRTRTEYGGCQVAEGGSLLCSRRFAMNDPAGRWELLARELLTNRTARTQFELGPPLAVDLTSTGGGVAGNVSAQTWDLAVVNGLSAPVEAGIELDFPQGVQLDDGSPSVVRLKPAEGRRIKLRATVSDNFYAGPARGELRVSLGEYVIAKPVFAVFGEPSKAVAAE